MATIGCRYPIREPYMFGEIRIFSLARYVEQILTPSTARVRV